MRRGGRLIPIPHSQTSVNLAFNVDDPWIFEEKSELSCFLQLCFDENCSRTEGDKCDGKDTNVTVTDLAID